MNNNDEHAVWAVSGQATRGPFPPDPRSDYGFVPVKDQLNIEQTRQKDFLRKAQEAGKDSNVGATLDTRHTTYGRFVDNAKIVQHLKAVVQDAINKHKRDVEFPADARESLDLICTKIGRLLSGDPNHGDTWHDIAGYAKLVEDRINGYVR